MFLCCFNPMLGLINTKMNISQLFIKEMPKSILRESIGN